MILQADYDPPGFTDWLSARLGTRRWMVGARVRKDYEIAISQKRYTELRNQWIASIITRQMFGGRSCA